MSQEASLMYELERQRRQELYLARVRNKTQEFYQRYRKQYDDMLAQGYDNYIHDEMSRLKGDLDTIHSLLSTGPEAARQVSQEVGSYIHSLWELGKEAKRVFQETARLERERVKKEQAERKNEALSRYFELLSGMDPIAAKFAMSELSAIKEAIISGEISAPQAVESRVGTAMAKASKEAAAWKKEKQQEQQKKTLVAQIEEQQEILMADNYEDKARGQAIMDKLADIKRRAAAGEIDNDGVKEQLQEVTKESDSVLVKEEERREMVKAIYKWFRAHDFTVSKPKMADGAVVLTAKRPSGSRAQFELTLDNKMLYRLDGYEGQSCLKDISSAKADWESVYGIKVSDEVVKWQNPDRILRQKGRTDTGMGGNA